MRKPGAPSKFTQPVGESWDLKLISFSFQAPHACCIFVCFTCLSVFLDTSISALPILFYDYLFVCLPLDYMSLEGKTYVWCHWFISAPSTFTGLVFLCLACCLSIAKFSAPALYTFVSDEQGKFIAFRCIRCIILDKIRWQNNSEYILHDDRSKIKKTHTHSLIYRLFNLALGRALEMFWYVL